ncbi:MAG: DsbA family protein [Alphaproteobacteria bacterium]
MRASQISLTLSLSKGEAGIRVTVSSRAVTAAEGNVRPVPLGLRWKQSFAARPEDTAAAKGNTGVEVVSTVSLILMIEAACGRLLQPYFEADDATVGARVEVDHIGAAHVGRPVDVEARLEAIDGRRYSFAVDLEQDGRTVMTGRHVRVQVSLARFLGRAPAASDPGPEVEFWFDVHSPCCYLASHRIGCVVRGHGGRVRWRPVHLAKLIEAIDGRRPLEENAAFVAWYRQDIVDQAELLGLPFRQHPNYPLRPSRALRAALWAERQGAAEPFVQAVMRAYWAEARDISDVGVLATLAEAVGLPREAIIAATSDAEFKSALDANLAEAIRRGLFGVPTAVFDGKLYFGNDHLDLLDRRLGAWRAAQAKGAKP